MSIQSQKLDEPSPLILAVDRLCLMSKLEIDHGRYVRQAFLLGLWHESFPEYMLETVEHTWAWNYPQLCATEHSHIYATPWENLQKFQFISNTGDSWHQCYRDLRAKGWKRLRVHRDGGRLQYLLHNHRLSFPEGYRDTHLVLDISIATCKQVQVGTEIKEVPIMKTVCEDLADIQEDERYSIPPELPPVSPPTANPNEEFASLLGVSGLEETLDVERIAADVFNEPSTVEPPLNPDAFPDGIPF